MGGYSMIRVYLAAVDVVPAAIVIVPVFLLLYVTAYRRDFRKTALHCLFCLYMAAMFSLVGIPNVIYFRPSLTLNLIPFLGIAGDLKNSLLNVALFVPLGCFLPILQSQYRKFAPTVFFGLGLSAAIELLQMLTYRATDVNDLITNVLGTAVGFLLAKPICRRCTKAGKRIWDVYALIALSFSVMFFIHPFLSPMIWDRIL